MVLNVLPSYLLTLGFSASQADSSLFAMKHNGDLINLLYIDDIIITGTNDRLIGSLIY